MYNQIKYENTKMINLFKKLLLNKDNSKKFDARVWIQLALLNKNLKSLKY